MIKRPAFCACWVLCAATGLVFFQATIALAEPEGEEDGQSALKSEVQRKLDALYEREGKKAPNMMPSSRSAGSSAAASGPRIQRASSDSSAHTTSDQALSETNLRQRRRPADEAALAADKAADDADEELEQLEAQRAARRAAGRNARKVEEEKPSLLERLNPFKSRTKTPTTTRPHSSKSHTQQQAQQLQQTPRAESARRRAYTPEELQPENPDARTAESKSRFRFLPDFLRRREPELPREERAARPTEESIAGRATRTARPAQRALPRDEERALPSERINESIVKDAPKRAPKAAPAKSLKKDDVENWAAPWDEEKESVAHKPGRENGRKAAPDASDPLESPFEQKNTEVARKASSAKKSEPSERILFDDEKQEFAESLHEKKTAAKAELATKAAPKPAEAVKTAQLPVQEEFPDPFTEVPEKVADKTDREVKEENPFTGLKLETEKVAAAPKSAAPIAPEKVAAAKKEIAPKIQPQIAAPPVETPKIAEILKNPETPKLADKDAPKPFQPDKAAELPNLDDPLQRAKLRRLNSRRGLAGLKGFCPVALRDRRDLVDTNPEISSIHEGKLYQFSSAEAKAAFDADPEKYAPAQGGTDVIIQVNSHQAIDGTLDHAVWFHDKLYLFSSPESLEAFVLNPTEYAHAER